MIIASQWQVRWCRAQHSRWSTFSLLRKSFADRSGHQMTQTVCRNLLPAACKERVTVMLIPRARPQRSQESGPRPAHTAGFVTGVPVRNRKKLGFVKGRGVAFKKEYSIRGGAYWVHGWVLLGRFPNSNSCVKVRNKMGITLGLGGVYSRTKAGQ